MESEETCGPILRWEQGQGEFIKQKPSLIEKALPRLGMYRDLRKKYGKKNPDF